VSYFSSLRNMAAAADFGFAQATNYNNPFPLRSKGRPGSTELQSDSVRSQDPACGVRIKRHAATRSQNAERSWAMIKFCRFCECGRHTPKVDLIHASRYNIPRPVDNTFHPPVATRDARLSLNYLDAGSSSVIWRQEFQSYRLSISPLAVFVPQCLVRLFEGSVIAVVWFVGGSSHVYR